MGGVPKPKDALASKGTAVSGKDDLEANYEKELDYAEALIERIQSIVDS